VAYLSHNDPAPRGEVFLKIAFGVFIILHGLVHLLYFGQTNRYFELKPGMTWPTGSWAFSHILNDGALRFLASIFLALAGFGFIASGVGTLFNLAWHRALIIIIAILSALIFIFFWSGGKKDLDGQGLLGVLIDIWLFVMVALVHWP
jgi:hypothetical protein